MESFVKKYFKRFDWSQRLQHLVLFLTFLGLGLTGMPQLFADNALAQGWLNLLGGGENARTIHHICGTGLILVGIYHIIELLVRALVGKGSKAMLPTPHDAKTVFQNIKYYLGMRKEHPEFDRYDYMEKMEYLSLIWGTFVMAVTGLMLWFPITTISIFPGQAIPAALAVHQWEAVLAGAYVLIVHMYFAHFKPQSFPYDAMMTDGLISEQDFAEHHPKEYEEVTGKSPHDLHHEDSCVHTSVVAEPTTSEAEAPKDTKPAKAQAKSEKKPAEKKSGSNGNSNGGSEDAIQEASDARRQALM